MCNTILQQGKESICSSISFILNKPKQTQTNEQFIFYVFKIDCYLKEFFLQLVIAKKNIFIISNK